MEESNVKAMREALKQIHDRVNSLDEDCGVDPVEIRDIARAALSATPRNCDRFSNLNDALEAFAKERGKIMISFILWLFAEAKVETELSKTKNG